MKKPFTTNNLWLRKWAKTHLQQSRISKLFRDDPGPPAYREGRASRRGEGRKG